MWGGCPALGLDAVDETPQIRWEASSISPAATAAGC